MINYKYKAVSKNGKIVVGFIEAYSEFEAIDKIRFQYPIIESLSEVKRKIDFSKLNEPFTISEKMLSLTCNQFSILMKAGLPMVRVIEIISEQSPDVLIKKILNKSAEDVSAGHGLADSFEKNSQKLPVTFIETVRAGEESGTLEKSFKRLSLYYEKSYQVKQKVQSAMIYPAFMIVASIIVLAIVMIVLVPSLMITFKDLDIEMPAITLALIATSDFFKIQWPYMILVLTALIASFISFAKTDDGKMKLAKLSLKIPIIGKITLMNSASQFANTMSTLLAAGLSITRCFTILSNVLDNKAIALSVSEIVPKIEEGKRIGEAMRDNLYFPKMLIEMTSVGEEAGTLEDTLLIIGEYYDSEAKVASDRALGMLEPTITVMLAGMIVFILASVYLPMLEMYSGMA